MSRPFTETVYNSLKSAFKAVIDDVGGLEALASSTRVNKSILHDYANRFSAKFVPVDVLLDAEMLGQAPHVTAALARCQGYELVPVQSRSADKLSVELVRIGRDTADLFSNATKLLAGGTVSASERAAMIVDLDDLARAARETALLLTKEA
jgi:hypothetical protein